MSTISNSWSQMLALGSAQLGTVAPTATDFGLAPANLLPDTFRSWTFERQSAYLSGRASPVTIGAAVTSRPMDVTVTTRPAFALSMYTTEGGGTSNRDVTAEVGLVEPARATDFSKAPAALSPAIFLSWTRAEQLRYAAEKGSVALGSFFDVGSSSGQGLLRVRVFGEIEMETGAVYGASAATGGAAGIPYYHLNGSTDGMPSKLVLDQAEALFPTIDGDAHRLDVADRPDGFYTNPTSLSASAAEDFMKKFVKWHSGYQLEYIKAWGSGDPKALSIPAGAATPVLSAMVSKVDDTQFYIVSSLDKAAFAKMAYADQVEIATKPGFSAIATRAMLEATSTATIKDITGASSSALSLTAAVDALTTYITTTKRADNVNNQPMPQPDRGYFTVQLDILKEQLGKMGVAAPADVSKRLSDIKDRFDRAFAFYNVKNETGFTAYMGIPATNTQTMYKDVISLDGNQTINNGYKIFIAQERRIAETVSERMRLVKDNGALYGRNLDVPELVFRFQSLYNLQLEAEVVMETEEVNQQNALLKTYAKIQDIINDTISKFKKADEDGKYLLDRGVDDLRGDQGNFSDEQRKIISMFDDLLGKFQKHPLETLRNLDRPKFDYISQYNFTDTNLAGGSDNRNYDLNQLTHLQWSGFGTRLSEAVTVINQNSQIKMNDINSTDKQRNRHFELANSALSKMSEMINNIARAG